MSKTFFRDSGGKGVLSKDACQGSGPVTEWMLGWGPFIDLENPEIAQGMRKKTLSSVLF